MHSIPFPIIAIGDLETLGPDLVPRVVVAVAGGLEWVCLRAKSAGIEERVRLGRELSRLPAIFLTVHGDPEACRELSAPGLHLPSRGFDVPGIRSRFPSVVLGVSCHGRSELLAAARAGADYAFLSPLFAPCSKPLQGRSLGVEGFRQAVEGIDMPVLALGGVTPARLADAARAGAAGAAALGALFRAPDVAQRAHEYCREAKRVFRASPG